MMEKKKFDENNPATIIGPGTVIEGHVNSQGTIRVEGGVNGRVDCDDTIVVHESGQVRADLIAGQVIISGTVEGNVFAHERLEIANAGKVVGNITSPRISIAEGVIFEGQCTMKPPGEMKPPASKMAKKDEKKEEKAEDKKEDKKAPAEPAASN